MSAVTVEVRKRWWLLCYGVWSLSKAMDTCHELVSRCKTNSDPLFGPLSVAIHTYYARPFKKSNGVGALPDDLIPDDSLGLHSWLIHFRDGVMVHTDANPTEVAGGFMHEVVYNSSGGELRSVTAEPSANPAIYGGDVLRHAQRLMGIMAGEVLALHEKYGDELPKVDGDFLLSLDPQTPLFVPHALKVTAKLNYPNLRKKRNLSP